MKIKPEHYKVLKEAIENLGVNNIKIHKIKLLTSDTPPKNLDKRVRWDCLYATKIKIGDSAGLDGIPLYAYMDDRHIDTALINIMKELNI